MTHLQFSLATNVLLENSENNHVYDKYLLLIPKNTTIPTWEFFRETNNGMVEFDDYIAVLLARGVDVCPVDQAVTYSL
jgi:hypothetical protein